MNYWSFIKEKLHPKLKKQFILCTIWFICMYVYNDTLCFIQWIYIPVTDCQWSFENWQLSFSSLFQIVIAVIYFHLIIRVCRSCHVQESWDEQENCFQREVNKQQTKRFQMSGSLKCVIHIWVILRKWIKFPFTNQKLK